MFDFAFARHGGRRLSKRHGIVDGITVPRTSCPGFGNGLCVMLLVTRLEIRRWESCSRYDLSDKGGMGD